MQVYEYVSNEWVEVFVEWDYSYIPKSSSYTGSGVIRAITGTEVYYYGGVLFGVQPNTQYKIIFNENVMSTLINPSTTSSSKPCFWIATVHNGDYPNARTVSGSSISRELVNKKTEITVTTEADATSMVFCYANSRGTSSNRAQTYFNQRYDSAQELFTGWTPRTLNKADNGWGAIADIHIYIDSEWYT